MFLIIKIFYSVIFIPYMVVALVLVGGAAMIVSLFMKDGRDFLFSVSKFWSKYIIMPFAARVSVNGVENIPKNTPVIFMSNHQSYFDIPIIMANIPGSYRFIVKREYFKTPILGPYTKWSGHLSVDREVGSSAHKSMMEAKEMMDSGKSIVIFPEGTRSPDGKLKKFKRGGFLLAFEAGAPIVPVAISGSHKLIRKKSLIVWPGRVKVSIGRPLYLKSGRPSKEIYQRTMDFIRNEIKEMLSEEERG